VIPTEGQESEEAQVTPVESGISGQGLAISKSDVSDLESSLLTSGEVLFIPEEHAVNLAAVGGFDPSDVDSMRHAFFQIEDESFAQLAGIAATIGTDGRFTIGVPAGYYLVCLANIFVDHSPGPPYSVVGCDVIDLPNEASLTVSFGEGGAEAILD
jgi:hypothetical protein